MKKESTLDSRANPECLHTTGELLVRSKISWKFEQNWKSDPRHQELGCVNLGNSWFTFSDFETI